MERSYADQEAHAAKIALSTAASFEYLAFSIDFPTEPSSVLDVGAGGSDVTAQLLSRGYPAYAVDPRYAVPGLVEKKVEEGYTKLDPSSPLYKHQQPIIREQQAALEVFKESMKTNPTHYISASATALPFSSETFDFVFSVNAITEYHSMNKLMLFDAVNECLRVTRSGGRVELFPVKVEVSRQDESDELKLMTLIVRQHNFKKLLEKLDKDGIDYELIREVDRHNRLVIYKD